MKIIGSGIYTDANGRNNKIVGVCELPESNKLQELKLSGNLFFEKIFCEEVSISGKCEGGSLSAHNVNISGKYEGKSITAKTFSASGKVEIDSIKIEDSLKISGKPKSDFVAADEIIIAACAGSLGVVKCRKIKIFEGSVTANEEFFGKNFVEYFSFNESHSRVQIKNIEANIVELENCAVEVIRCQNAFIGKNCVIDKLFVAGECEVAADSTVVETIRI